MKLGQKVYLGNYTYARYTGDGIELTYRDGAENKHKIFLDHEALPRFDKFRELILKSLDQYKEQLENAKKNS